MNADSPRHLREELETRLTALLLGELNADDVELLRKLIAQDTALAALYQQLELAIKLVRETGADPIAPSAPLRLSDGRREKLLAHFKTVRVPAFAPKKRRARITLLELAVVLAIIAILASVMLPTLSSSKMRSRSVALLSDLRQVEVAKQLWASENKKSAADEPTLADLKPYLRGGESSLAGGRRGTYIPGKVGEPAAVELDIADARAFRKKLPEAQNAPVDANGQRVRIFANGTAAFAPQSRGTPWQTEYSGGVQGFGSAKGKPMPTTPLPRPASSADANYQVAAETATRTRIRGEGSIGIALPSVVSEADPPAGALRFGTWGDTQGETTVAAGMFGNDSDSEGKKRKLDGANNFSDFFTAITPDDATSLRALERGGSSGAKRNFFDVDGEALGVSEQPAQPYSNSGTLSAHYKSLNTLGTEVLQDTTKQAVTDNSFVNGTVPNQDFWGKDAGAKLATGTGESFGLYVPGANAGKAAGVQEARDETRALGFEWFTSGTAEGQVATTPTSAGEPIIFGRGMAGAPTYAFEPSTSFNRTEESVPQKPVGDDVIAPMPALLGVRPNVVGGPGGINTLDADAAHTTAPASRNSQIVLPVTELNTASTADTLQFINSGKLALNEMQVIQLSDPAQSERTRQELLGLNSSNVSRRGDSLATGFGSRGGFGGGGGEVRRQTAPTDNVRRQLEQAAQAERDKNPDKAAVPYYHALDLASRLGPRAEAEKELAPDKITTLSGRVAQLSTYSLTTTTNRVFTEYATRADRERLRIQFANPTPNAIIALTNSAHQSKTEGLSELEAKPDSQLAALLRDREAAQQRLLYLEKDIQPNNEIYKNAQQRLKELNSQIDGRVAQRPSIVATNNLVADHVDETPARPATPPPVPQPEVLTRDNAFSTFSLNVSDVSFKLAGASLQKGVMPEPASIRTEEFINAFDYRDPEASPGVAIAFASERARYPFAHNRDLLRFSLKTAAEGRQAGRPLNVVLLLDNSGSMERADRVRIIREALRVLASQLQPQDKFSVVTFSRAPRLWVDGVPGSQASGVADGLGNLTPEGGTNLEEAMNLAYATALRHYLAGGINRVVLLTDGAANLGNVEPDTLKQKVESFRKQGIALDCFGIGWEGYNDDLLEVLARNGDGRYGFINSPAEAATEFAAQLAGALKVAASDVKVQVEFNPKRVTSYRQIGYAKHQLTKEQFRDNTVDAAEIAAREAGNALYTVEVNPAGEGPIAVVRVRYKVPGTAIYREQEWAVPFTSNAVSMDEASPAMRLASTASAFSEWLASSPFAGEVTPDRLLVYLGGIAEVCGADTRPQQLEWMIRQSKSITGK